MNEIPDRREWIAAKGIGNLTDYGDRHSSDQFQENRQVDVIRATLGYLHRLELQIYICRAKKLRYTLRPFRQIEITKRAQGDYFHIIVFMIKSCIQTLQRPLVAPSRNASSNDTDRRLSSRDIKTI